MTLNLTNITVENLLAFSATDLQDFKAKLNTAIEKRKEQDKKNVHSEMQALASKHGFSLDEFLVKQPKKAKMAKMAKTAKYRNPANHQEVWAGRGRKPNWLLALLAAGRRLEEFKV